MSQNTLPSGLLDLLQLARPMSAGLEAHARWLPFAPDAAEQFAAKLARLETAEADFAAARTRKAGAGACLAAADAAQTAWLGKARLVVMLLKGAAWSESWVETGFTHRATAVPKRMAARTELCRRVAEHFAAHPEREYAPAGVTGPAGREISAEMDAAASAARESQADVALKKRARDTAERELRREMARVRIQLSVMLRMDDARWASFGLHQPTSARSALKPSRHKTAPGAEIIPLPVRTVEASEESAPEVAAA